MEEQAMTKYEMARIVGARALQLAMGAPFLLKMPEEQLEKLGYNVLEIAKLEFKEGVIPITVRRPAPKLIAKRGGRKEEAPEEKKAA